MKKVFKRIAKIIFIWGAILTVPVWIPVLFVVEIFLPKKFRIGVFNFMIGRDS